MYTEAGINIDKKLNSRKNLVTAVFIASIVLIFLLILQLLILTLSYDRVYDGVYLNNDQVSHLTRDELRTFISNKYNEPLKTATITITYNNLKWSIQTSDLNLLINEEKLADYLYAPGHTGSMFKRLADIVSIRMKKFQVDLFGSYSDFISYDRQKIDEIAERISKECYSDVIQHQLKVENNKVIITSGREGHQLPADKIRDTIINALNTRDSFNIDLREIAVVTKPAALNPDQLAGELYIPAVNARYVRRNNQIVIEPHQVGRKVNEAQLRSVISELEYNPDKSYTLDLIEIEPEIKAEDIKLPTFNDVLGQYTTRFSASEKNRNHNIALASSTINGYYLLPGEVFSFNQVVGDTTKQKGYLPAPTYVNGKLKDDYGGGVCQVSTTLYNAVINAGLEVVERHPHSMIVTYVPVGMDAAIATPYKDFKFKNNTAEPILITASTTSTSVTFKILGVNNNPGRKYTFETEILSQTDYKTVYQDDPTLDAGKTKVLQNGTPGYSVRTYRITYINGEKVKRELFSTSKYNPRNKIIARGTKNA